PGQGCLPGRRISSAGGVSRVSVARCWEIPPPLQETKRSCRAFSGSRQASQGSEMVTEALYLLSVARFTENHDAGALQASWQQLRAEYPHSVWTTRSQIPQAPSTQEELDIIQEASEESFPASDPPSWTSGR